jgi:SAM-dependent methyltransferase
LAGETQRKEPTVSTTAKDKFAREYFLGERVYGDDFSLAQIKEWYEQEETGYYDLTKTRGAYSYGYHALNYLHGVACLKERVFDCCLALGCARGDDVVPLAPRVRKFIAIEPAEQWWSDTIGGTPASFVKPAISGDISLPDNAADLATCLGVLHHIPNAGHVLGEVARVLRPGGVFLMREPILTMGDWRKPRRGLTRNERGFPLAWLDQKIARHGFRVVRRRLCMFPGTTRFGKALGLGPVYNNRFLTMLDRLVSSMLSWNLHYHRDTIFKKVAPSSVFYVLEKQ